MKLSEVAIKRPVFTVMMMGALLVMGLKYIAYLITGSAALYSDALESIVNVVTAVVALARSGVGLIRGSKPERTNRAQTQRLPAPLPGMRS